MKNYYSIMSETIGDLSGRFTVCMNADCKVYEGHFPGSPVSPGVCNIEMLLECAERVLQFPLRMTKLNRCRLTTLITPLAHPQLDIQIDLRPKEQGLYLLNASIGRGEDTYLTLKAETIRE